MTVYVPRPYQRPMTQFMVDNPRVNMYAGMGVGKSPATLEAIAQLFLFGEITRVLVLAPKRVAQSTWPGEIAKFKGSFGHMTYAVAVGDAATRHAAILSNAQLVFMNYENLTWLVDNYGATWNFCMVVCDESSRLASLRVSLQRSKTGKQFLTGQGGSRAKSLARVALTKTKRFVNLSGTPAANGLDQLWGQVFFLDSGRRLGSSFTSFSHRWFRSVPGSSREQARIEPLPFADEQIRAAIKDITMAVEAKDHFDLPPLTQTLAELAEELADSTVTALGIHDDGRLIGAVRVHRSENAAELGRLIVAPDRQGQGIGTRLLLHAETVYPEASEIRLFTGEHSAANIRLYTRHGYHETSRTSAGSYQLVNFVKAVR